MVSALIERLEQGRGKPIPDCRPITLEWAVTFLTATVQATAISGDQAAATLSNHQTVQLRRTATGEWLIDKLGPDGLPAELRRKLMRSGGLTGSAVHAGPRVFSLRRRGAARRVVRLPARRAAP